MAFDLADDRSVAASSGPMEPLLAVEPARNIAPGLRPNGARKRPDRTNCSLSACDAQCVDPTCNGHRIGNPYAVWRGYFHRVHHQLAGHGPITCTRGPFR